MEARDLLTILINMKNARVKTLENTSYMEDRNHNSVKASSEARLLKSEIIELIAMRDHGIYHNEKSTKTGD